MAADDPEPGVALLPSTSAAVMGDGVDDVAFPSGFSERAGPGLWEVRFNDRDESRWSLPMIGGVIGLPVSLGFAAFGSVLTAGLILATLTALWVRVSMLRVRITVERGAISTARWPIGWSRTVEARDCRIEHRFDPTRVVAVMHVPWEHEILLAKGMTPKQARVLAERINRALGR